MSSDREAFKLDISVQVKCTTYNPGYDSELDDLPVALAPHKHVPIRLAKKPPRMVVTPYNNHVGSFLPGLGWFAPPKSTRAGEPTLLWNQFHQQSDRDCKRVIAS